MKKLLRKIRLTNSVFLIGTFTTTCTAVPLYIWHYGLDVFQVALFLFFAISTGMSITLGYHRLFSHLTFQASPIVKLYTLLFGAAAFEGSALGWCADHRRHHKHVDHEEDPYDINKGLFHAHIGWLLFRRGPDSPLTWVRDLQKDKLAWWQHEYYVPIAMIMSFIVPAAIGWAYGGPVAALGGFLIAGVARVVFVHHMTFCINSLCHWIGKRPYSSNVSARDSLLMAFFTFGEGYHNFHHTFQWDYRNGVSWWHFDPTKWFINLCERVGLTSDLKRCSPIVIESARLDMQYQRAAQSFNALEGMIHNAEAWRARLESEYEQCKAALQEWARHQQRWYEAKSTQLHEKWSHFEQMKLRDSYREARYRLKLQKQRWEALMQSVPALAGVPV